MRHCPTYTTSGQAPTVLLAKDPLETVAIADTPNTPDEHAKRLAQSAIVILT